MASAGALPAYAVSDNVSYKKVLALVDRNSD